jgi:hypothetical protein
VRQKDPESRTLARWSPEKDHKAQSNTNRFRDIVEDFRKAR